MTIKQVEANGGFPVQLRNPNNREVVMFTEENQSTLIVLGYPVRYADRLNKQGNFWNFSWTDWELL